MPFYNLFMAGDINFNPNTQNVNYIETNSQFNQASKEYSYGFRERLKSIGRYLTYGFNPTKRRNVVLKEFSSINIPDISKLKNRSSEVKTALLTSDKLSIQKKLIIYNEYKTEIDAYIQKHNLEHPIGKEICNKLGKTEYTNQQKLELYAQNRKAIDAYCQKTGIKNPLLGNSSFNDLEKITAHGIYTANFPTAENIEIFINAIDAYINKEFSTIEQTNNLDDKKIKMEKLSKNLQQMQKTFNKCDFNREPKVNTEKLSKQSIEKQHKKTLECFFKKAIIMQKLLRVFMPMNEWLNKINKTKTNEKEIEGAWNECKKQISFSDQTSIFNNIKSLEKFKSTLENSSLNTIHNFVVSP